MIKIVMLMRYLFIGNIVFMMALLLGKLLL